MLLSLSNAYIYWLLLYTIFNFNQSFANSTDIFSRARCQFCVQKGKEKFLVKVVVESGDVSCSWVLGQKGSLLPTFTPVDSTVKVYSVNQQSKPQINISIINPIIRDGGVVRDDFYEFFK